MAITAQQLADLQADAAIGTDESVFTNAELSRIWDRVSGAPTETIQHEAALALIYRQLLADANKFHDWKAGASEEKLSQIRANLKDQYEMYAPSLDTALSRSTQFARAVLVPKPTRGRTRPDNGDESDAPWGDSEYRRPR
jgi:hypothetical protein